MISGPQAQNANQSEECLRLPYLGVIDLACAEQGFQRVVAGDDKSSHVYKELAGNIEEDEEEVNSDKAEESVDFWNGRLLCEVVEHGVLGQLEEDCIGLARVARSGMDV